MASISFQITYDTMKLHIQYKHMYSQGDTDDQSFGLPTLYYIPVAFIM